MTTPYLRTPTGFSGERPWWRQSSGDVGLSRRLWLGLGLMPDGSRYPMLELPTPAPAAGMPRTKSNGESQRSLVNGAAASYRWKNRTRSWTYSWTHLAPTDEAIFDGFSARDFGFGPFTLVEPDGRNRLTRAQSMCLDASVWGTGAGTIAVSTTATAPIGPCGVLDVDLDVGAALLSAQIAPFVGPGPGVPTPDVMRSPVNVPAEPFATGFFIWTDSGTASVHARITSTAADGTVAETIDGATVSVGTTPTLVHTSGAPGAFGSGQFLIPQLISVDGHAFHMANPVASYSRTVLDWLPGGGVPRVGWGQALDETLSRHFDADLSMTFTESILGVA